MDAEAPLLEDTGRGLTVYYRSRHLYSTQSPVASAERRAAGFAIPSHTLVLLPSPLLFYGVPLLLARLPETCHVLAIEADQKLMALSLESAGRIATDPRISYVRTESVKTLKGVLDSLHIGRFRRCIEIRLSGGYALSSAFYQQVFESVQGEIQAHWRNRLTLIELSSLWIKNVLLNLPEILSARDLRDTRIPLPIVVAGAGESLEGALEPIRSVRDRVYLLAVDTALPTLVHSGVRPDAVFVLEGQFANIDDFVAAGLAPGSASHSAGLRIMADLCSNPAALRASTKPVILFLSDFAPSALARRLAEAQLRPLLIPPLGSVGVAALYCALDLTEAPVFVAGLDFSYQLGKTHARGAPAHLRQLEGWSRTRPPSPFQGQGARALLAAENKSGGTVVTDPILLGYRRLLGEVVAGEQRVFDIGERGLDLGLPRCSLPEKLAAVLREAHASSAAAPAREAPESLPHGSRDSSESERRSTLLSFLRREEGLLASAAAAALRHLDVLSRGSASEREATAALEEVDYVYLHFPDPPPLPSVDPGFLKRAVESIDTCRSWIERSLRRLTEEQAPRA